MLVERTMLTKKAVRTALEVLEAADFVGTLKGTRGTLVTIRNWEEIFGWENAKGTLKGTIKESSSTSVEEVPPPPAPPAAKKAKASPEDERLGREWREFAVSESPHLARKMREADCAEAIRKLRELDDYSHETLRAVLGYVRQDDRFWRKNALSPVGLRKIGSNGLPKIESIRASMETSGYRAPISDEQKRRMVLDQLSKQFGRAS